jgi:hypothetical protein
MSTRPGGGPKRGPRNQNRTAFKHNPHSAKSAVIAALPNEGLCKRCADIIEWRKKFHKFKPLSAPRSCADCHAKTVMHAYHMLCVECARRRGCCAKCCQPREIVTPVQTAAETRAEQEELDLRLSEMSLRERRSFFRKLDRGEIDATGAPTAAAAAAAATDSDDDDSDCSSCDSDKHDQKDDQ